MRPSGAHNPKASNKTSVKEQIRRIRLSVIDFEHGERAEGMRAYRVVLSSRQLSLYYW